MIYPMYAMVILTVIVSLVMVRSRVVAVRDRKVHPKYFKTMSGAELPDSVALPARQYINLFELPVLFYAACLTAMQMQAAGPVMVALAWIFVVSRYVHAFIHLTSNSIYPRMAAFGVGLLTVLVMWTLMVASLS